MIDRDNARSSTPENSKASAGDSLNRFVTSQQEMLDAIVQVFAEARREVRLFSEAYEPAIFEADALLGAIRTFVCGRSGAGVLILAPAAVLSPKTHPGLANITQRMSSKIFIRENSDVDKYCQGQFVLGDRRAVFHQPDMNNRHAYCNSSYPVRVQQLRERFDSPWEMGTVPADFRVLSI